MKMRNKGKVHPFTSSSSSSPNRDSLSVLNLLPAAILSLVSLLSLEDREVLAYMVTRSLKSTNPSFLPSQDKKTTTAKRCSFDGKSPPLFDCDCFHCYTSFWFRWDSSPNRELIHQAIESFDDRLNDGELLNFRRNKRKDRMGRRKSERLSGAAAAVGGGPELPAVESPGCRETLVVVLPEESVDVGEEVSGPVGVAADELVAAPAVVVRNHKGLARKVLPDVMGIFSSRLWSLWSPK
ncbi:hypothetical protein ACP275_11G075100 [Erythranthe tilingii]